MPETFLPIRTPRQRRFVPVLTLLLIGAALGGCSGGDFGRTRNQFRNDDIHRWIGGEATSSVGLRASQFQLTDNERQLRDLAYPLIEPPRSRADSSETSLRLALRFLSSSITRTAAAKNGSNRVMSSRTSSISCA